MRAFSLLIIVTQLFFVCEVSGGNHSNLNGALLSAFVLYQSITQLPADGLAYIKSINVPAETQLALREIAASVAPESISSCNNITYGTHTPYDQGSGDPGS